MTAASLIVVLSMPAWLMAATTLASMGFGGDGRRRGNGRAEQAATRARAAKDGAAEAFYSMDTAQRYLRTRIEALLKLDPSGEVERLRDEFSTLSARADTLSSTYIAITDAHDVDRVRDAGGAAAAYAAAQHAYSGIAADLTAMAGELTRFSARLAHHSARVEAALAELPPRIDDAEAAVAEAQNAVDVARRAGFQADEMPLQEARAALATLRAEGAPGLGLAGALAKAAEVRRLAEQARRDAEELPRAAEGVRRSLTGLRTRIQVIEGRADSVTDAFHQLRRRYSHRSWADLEGAQPAVSAALERARERLTEASRAADRQQWKHAQQSIAAARAELADADRRATGVTARLADLDAVAADPKAAADKTRFAVREAQKLAMASPRGPRPEHVRLLDGLVARVEAAPSILKGPHPDYYAYLRELGAIRVAAEDAVKRIRDDWAHGR
ncbi:molecular chaperone DnaJ [Microbispora sp. NPDC049125]|uniref:molecular chaperone DnaJ n=1 Tax=Microbispora sp. NPDC049125 TaxID=3154929 RepID=UPI003467345C